MQNLCNKNDIINTLPSPEYLNFFPIVNGLIKLFDEDIGENNRLLTSEQKDNDMNEYILEELELLQFKRNMCIKLLKKANQIKNIEDNVEFLTAKNLIFEMRDSGSSHIEHDLKGIL